MTTVEGIGASTLHPVQKAFMAHDALQCGFCTPGFIVEAAAFHDRWRAAKGTATPSREEIGAALSGHLCRCGAYDGIFNAVAAACAGQFDGDEFASPRVEARAKVTGAAKYTVDIRHDGQHEGVILRSQLAHARIAELDLAPARALAGVSAAVSLLGDDRIVRYVGDPIAAVAAKDRKTALAAIAAIRITSETPAVGDRARCRAQDRCAGGVRQIQPQERRQRLGRTPADRRPGTATSADRPRRSRTRPGRRGAGSRRARENANPLLVEATFRTGTQSHTCLEPHAAVARFDGDSLTVHVSTQAVFHLMELIAKRYKLVTRQGPRHRRSCRRRVRLEGAASASRRLPRSSSRARRRRRSGSPIDRHEELSVTGYRPAAEMKIALLPSEQGDLKALSLTAHADTGAATNSTIAALARLIYPAEAKAARRLRRHQQPAARRAVPRPRRAADGVRAGTGDRRSGAADEGRSDRVAQTLGSESEPAAALRLGCRARRLAQHEDARRRRPAAIAAASASPPATGSISGSPASKVELAVKSGRIVASTSTQDIGQGSRTVIANTVAHAFGLEPHEVEVRIGNSNLPEGPGAGGSRIDGFGDSADAARGAEAEGRDRAQRDAQAGPPAPTRRGAK